MKRRSSGASRDDPGFPAGGQGVGSVVRALCILDRLGTAGRDLGVTELARQLDLNKSTTFRLLATLVSLGYVTQDRETGKYRLGLHLVELGALALDRIDLRTEARPFLADLADRTGETVHLAILDRNQVVYIEKFESKQTLTMKSRVGAHAPAHCTGVGKALLAFLEHDELKRVVSEESLYRFTANTIADPQALLEHLERVRQLGYAIDDEEHELGIRCVAAPVRNHSGKVAAAISVSGPGLRLTRERIEEMIPLVVETSAKISRALGDVTHGRSAEALV